MDKLTKKEKHNHKLTDLLKFAIFSLVMLAPFLSIGVRCGYVMWNKNAKDSYSDYNYKIQSKEEVNKPSSIINNTTYYLQLNSIEDPNNNTSSSARFYFSYFENPNNQFNFSNAVYFTLGGEVGIRNGYYLCLWNNNGSKLRDYPINDYLGTYKVIINNVLTNTYFLDSFVNNQLFVFNTTQVEGTLDNAFSYSVSQISNDPIFNWTRNTGIYTPINAMCTGLGLQDDTLQILLAYWSINIAIYIVFDIIIWCFTRLTHFTTGN